ncbi:MAG TPA: sulfite oxidase-like oxidoreductase [Candidatus Acidoferrales bacterium]|nr:sulfite oxidase-like oxidoreductase [Candidatus Acidoferrales bacterium]
MQTTIPRGQTFAKRWAIYTALGVPKINLANWQLTTSGLVDSPLKLTFAELQKLPQLKLTKSFHCVTTWSIKDVVWEGVSFREIAKRTGVKPGAKWVMFHCADGYTAPVPLEDAMVEDSIIAYKLNGKPLPEPQGYPVRPFIPHLYGWKSAKWLTGIEFLAEYEDGYWEAYGYHERGNIWDEERFKGQGGKHVRHRGLGSVPV